MAKQRNPKRYTDEDREKAFALYAVSGSLTSVHEDTGIPISTIKTWVDNIDNQEEVAKLRNEKKREFAEKCWKPIEMGVELITRQMETCLEKQDELDTLLDMVNDIPNRDEEIPYKEKMRIIKEISRLARPDMRELTTAIGTLYDKQALAKGESTSNNSVRFELSNNLKDYAE